MTGGASERRRAVAVAGHRGDPTVPRAALRDPDPAVRGGALVALDRVGDLRPADVEVGAADPAPAVRRVACELAARHAVDVTALLDDPDPSVVEVAAWALGELDPAPDGAVAGLVRVAGQHEDPLCRESAVAALGAIGDPAGLDTILAALDDRAPVRRRAVLALAPFDDDRVAPAIARALDDRDWQVRQAAEDLSTTM